MKTQARCCLTQDEELLLIARAQMGDDHAKLRLVESLRGFVCHIARKRKISSAGLDLDDLIEYGILGLLKAIDRYDLNYQDDLVPNRIPRLSTFSKMWISGEISAGISEGMFTIRPPSGGQDPLFQMLPLDAPLGDSTGDGLILAEAIPDPLRFEGEVLSRHWLRSVLDGMPDPRWPGLLTIRFGLDGEGPAPLTELGKRTGLSTSAARTETLRAIRWLRQQLPHQEAILHVGQE